MCTGGPIPRRPIWRLQFRLRTLMVSMLVISIGFGWLFRERRRIAKLREVFDNGAWAWAPDEARHLNGTKWLLETIPLPMLRP